MIIELGTPCVPSFILYVSPLMIFTTPQQVSFHLMIHFQILIWKQKIVQFCAFNHWTIRKFYDYTSWWDVHVWFPLARRWHSWMTRSWMPPNARRTASQCWEPQVRDRRCTPIISFKDSSSEFGSPKCAFTTPPNVHIIYWAALIAKQESEKSYM